MVLALTVALTACGGGSDGTSDAPDTPAGEIAPDVPSDAADVLADAIEDGTPGDLPQPLDTPLDPGGDAWQTSTDVTEAYCRPWALWTCARVLACGCGAPAGGAPTEEECLALALDECAGNTVELAAAVAAGLAVISVPDVEACRQALALAAGPCGQASESEAGPACARQFAEPGTLGAACSQSPCAGGQGACVEGTCVTLSAEGGPCQHRAHCVAGDCVDNTCRLPAADGAECDTPAPACAAPALCLEGHCAAPTGAGGPCDGDVTCQPPLACLAGVCAAFPDLQCTLGAACGNHGLCLGTLEVRCEALGGPGAACVGDAGCQPGYTCLQNLCTASPGPDEPCASGTGCALGLACRFEGEQAGTCGPLPGKGDPCALDVNGPFVCGPGLACMADLFVCNDPPVGGEPCANPNLCARDDFNGDGKVPDIACDFTADGSFCALRKGVDEPCQNDQICGEGLYCDYTAGACKSVYPLGTNCAVGNECGPDAACIPNAAGDLACRPLPGVGDACLFDCQPGAWCHAKASDLSCQPPVCQLMYLLH